MYRSYHLGHHGEACLLGKGQHLFLLAADKFGHGGDAGGGEQLVNQVGRDVGPLGALGVYSVDNLSDAGHVHSVDDHVLVGRGGRLHDLGQGGGQRHLVAEVHVAALEKLLHLRPGSAHAGQDGEDGLATLLDLLVEHVVDLEEFHQSGCAEDDHDGVDVGHVVLAEVDGYSQMLGGAGGQDVDGVGHAAAWQQLCFQLFGRLARQGRHVHATLRQGVGEHHAGASGMGDNGEVLAVEARQGEDAAHGGQLLATEAAHDACLAEEGFHGRVAAGHGAGVAAGGTAAGLRRASLDGGDAAALADEAGGVEKELVGVGNVLDVEQFY